MADAVIVSDSPREALSDLTLTTLTTPDGQGYPSDAELPADLYTADQPPSVDELADPSLAVPVNDDLEMPGIVEDEEEQAAWAEAGGMQFYALDTEAEHSDEHPGVVAPTCPVDSYAAQDAAGNWSCVAQYGAPSKTNWLIWAAILVVGVVALRK